MCLDLRDFFSFLINSQLQHMKHLWWRSSRSFYAIGEGACWRGLNGHFPRDFQKNSVVQRIKALTLYWWSLEDRICVDIPLWPKPPPPPWSGFYPPLSGSFCSCQKFPQSFPLGPSSPTTTVLFTWLPTWAPIGLPHLHVYSYNEDPCLLAFVYYLFFRMGFPGGANTKESTC